MVQTNAQTGSLDRVAIWRILLGFVIAVVIYGVIGFGAVFGFFMVAAPTGFDIESMIDGSSKSGIAVFLATFVPVWFGVYVAMLWPIRQKFSLLFGPSRSINWRDAFWGFALAAVVVCTIEAISAIGFMLTGQTHHMENHDIALLQWLVWVIPVFVLIVFQIGAEEIIFRGYLLRTIWARGGRLFWAVFAPAFVFGMGHYSPDMFGQNAWLYVINTTVTGVLLACVTLFRNNIGAAMGIHLAVNTFAFLIVGNSEYFSAMALLLTDIGPKSDETTIAFVAFTCIEVIVYVIWARSNYGRLVP